MLTHCWVVVIKDVALNTPCEKVLLVTHQLLSLPACTPWYLLVLARSYRTTKMSAADQLIAEVVSFYGKEGDHKSQAQRYV